jgi:hypothetical protein
MRLRYSILGALGVVALCAVGFAASEDGKPLTDSDVQLGTRELSAKMTVNVARIKKLVDEAQKKKDMVKLNCLADKSQQVQGHLTLAEKSKQTLIDAFKAKDASGRDHAYNRLSILSQKIDVLRTEAETCFGEDVPYVGITVVTVEIDPSIPPEDPTQYPIPAIDVTRPAESSPTGAI